MRRIFPLSTLLIFCVCNEQLAQVKSTFFSRQKLGIPHRGRDQNARYSEDGRTRSALGPSVLALRTQRGGGSTPTRLLSFGAVYALSLLGSSIGFYSFLYFISVGYSLGITLPLLAALQVYGRRYRSASIIPRSAQVPSTVLHTVMVILWGIRAFSFFLWREHVNWPALHKQIRHVNETSPPSMAVKCFIWIIYSFLYTAMLSPCWFRLERSARILSSTTTMTASHRNSLFNLLGALLAYFPMALQLLGLVLESVADYQKSMFKVDNRHDWCNVGLWRWSTHPHYLGEMIFWTGTYLGWILLRPADSSSGPPWWRQFAFCSLGYAFIVTVLRGSVISMGRKHWQKYGHIPEYAEFRQSHGFLGPKRQDATAAAADDDNPNLPPQ